MPSWLLVIVNVAVAALAVAGTAAVNIRIKFAPDAESAKRGLRDFALTVLGWGSSLLNVVLLVWNVASPEPLTRFGAFMIALQVGSVVFLLTMLVMARFLDWVLTDAEGQTDLLLKTVEEQRKQAALIGRHLGITEKLSAGAGGGPESPGQARPTSP
ncbi:MAG TPA: hypothetical protein VFI25_11340 [Planctomycetota bacterium]|jgi:hypothetical protein|nr:hypothetical protein [Planctomycetota bacterium]